MSSDFCRPGHIRETLAAHGFRFDKRKGQNFLVADWVPERMAALFSGGQAVLEIGPGFGALTAALSRTCGAVVAVEKDRRLIPVLKSNLSGFANVKLIEGDALRVDLAALMPNGLSPAVCANLPYSLTTPLLTALLEKGPFDPVVVMVQREVAARLTAVPSAPDYGALTVFAALHARCVPLFDVPPGCFMPRPAVTSTVVRFGRRNPSPDWDGHIAGALRLVRAAFAQRRKTLSNALSAGLAAPRGTVDERLSAAGIDPSARGETLSPEDYIRLARFFD